MEIMVMVNFDDDVVVIVIIIIMKNEQYQSAPSRLQFLISWRKGDDQALTTTLPYVPKKITIGLSASIT